MPDQLSVHAPILVNTLGHCAGAAIFGILVYLFLLDYRRDARDRGLLPVVAAALAIVWNLGSLLALSTGSRWDLYADVIVAASFSALSLLPAVLLHISLGGRSPALRLCGYVIGGIAVMLHIADAVTGAPRFHYASILLVTVGFGTLTALSVVRESVGGSSDGSGPRLAGAMVLFLFSISFAHFESANDLKAWSGEAALHHAGIPLALFVLLQDYRFLLLDAFIRFVVNAVFAAATVAISFAAYVKFGLTARLERDPFAAGIVFVAACALLSLFAYTRAKMQRWLTRVLFLRANSERVSAELRNAASKAKGESEYVDFAAGRIADFFSSLQFEFGRTEADRAFTVSDPAKYGLPRWARATAPFRFARGDSKTLVLGPRGGGRRYLSEDIEILERLAATVVEQVERMRSSELQGLASRAELRALQAQINPHFFFNALNTLYGSIARENSSARRMVTNLSSLFRYSFSGDRVLIRIEEELRMVRAYLEIESLRLGPRLRVGIDVDDTLLQTEVPVLSIQPLVENAVKHGVAAFPGHGFVRLSIRAADPGIVVEVSNSGAFGESASHEGTGMGLSNVQRRMVLCYGADAAPTVESTGSGNQGTTTVRYSIPAPVRRGA